MATVLGTPPVGGRIESEARRAQRRHLMAALERGFLYFARYPTSHDAEICYHSALEELVRFEERRGPGAH